MTSDSPFAPPSAAERPFAPPPELQPVEVRFELEEQEFLAIARRKMFKNGAVLYVGLAVGLGLFAFGYSGSKNFLAQVAGYAVVALAIGSLSFFTNWLAPRKRFRTLRPEQRQQWMRFGPEHFESADEESSSKLSWKRIVRFEALPDALLVYISPYAYHLVPRRAFPSEADFHMARAWLEAKVVAQPQKASGGRRTLILWVLLILMFLALYQLLGSGR
jgi:hypothetical protein